MFTDANALSKQQISTIMMTYNPGLIDRGFDIAVYEASQQRGINPKIILATLMWEQGWCKNGNYDKAFGVGAAGSPNSYSAKDFGGLGQSIDTYMKFYEEGLTLDMPYSMNINKDAKLQDKGYSGTSQGYVDQNPQSRNYFINGQNIGIVSAAMYARIRYNQWLYYPPDSVHTTKVWHDSVTNF